MSDAIGLFHEERRFDPLASSPPRPMLIRIHEEAARDPLAFWSNEAEKIRGESHGIASSIPRMLLFTGGLKVDV